MDSGIIAGLVIAALGVLHGICKIVSAWVNRKRTVVVVHRHEVSGPERDVLRGEIATGSQTQKEIGGASATVNRPSEHAGANPSQVQTAEQAGPAVAPGARRQSPGTNAEQIQPTGQADPAAAGAAEASFDWKGERRTIPMSPNAPLPAGCPNEPFARWLLGLLLGALPSLRADAAVERPAWLSGSAVRQPTGPFTATYSAAGKFLGEGYEPLKTVQAWCREKKMFDLSAVIVQARTGVPGRGNFGPWPRYDCENQIEWQQYMTIAIGALRETLGRGEK